MRRNTILMLIILILSGCEYSDSRLKIINKTGFEIATEVGNKNKIINFNFIDFYLEHSIKPDSTIEPVMDGKNGWNNFVLRGQERKLYIYVFAIDTLIKYKNKSTMEELTTHKKYYSILEFSKDYLDKCNWHVVVGKK